MSRTITVKGIGKATAKVDYVVISMTLESQNTVYDKAVEKAAKELEQLRAAVAEAGFLKDELKTTNFNVRTEYEGYNDKNGQYKRRFAGYVVCHSLKLAFDFDSERLATALSAIAGCVSNPELNISFTVKDTSAINEEMLAFAAVNAREKAELLCKASGVKLGTLMSIDYNWNEMNVCSTTRFALAEDCVAAPMMAKQMNFEPEDIRVQDSVVFVWDII